MIPFDTSYVVQAVVVLFLGAVGRSVWHTGTAVAVLGESVKLLWAAVDRRGNGCRECEHHPRRRARR